MRRTKLDQRILRRLMEKTEGKMTEGSIRTALSRTRRKYPSLTLNAAAEVFAKKRSFTVSRYLNEKDRETLKTIVIEKVRVPSTRVSRRRKIVQMATYKTDDKLLNGHLDEINKTYTYGCYTATFILCRKVLENLIIHHIVRRKYPENTREHRSKYFDFNRNRPLDFDRLLANLRGSSSDFIPDRKLVERICQLAKGFKETANEMTHSLYHIATRKEIDGKNFQHILDLIGRLEEGLNSV